MTNQEKIEKLKIRSRVLLMQSVEISDEINQLNARRRKIVKEWGEVGDKIEALQRGIS